MNLLPDFSAYAENPAVRCRNTVFSYADLDRRSMQLAAVLRSHGAGQDRPVAICLERSTDIIVAIIAALRAGAPYVPLDPSLPVKRLRFMLNDCRAPVVVTTSAFQPDFITTAIVLEMNRALPIAMPFREEPPQPEDLAYIIYTSGSTGEPKGVLCHHRGACNMLADGQGRRPLGPSDRCSWWTSPGFDVSVYEIFSALTVGAELVVVPEAVRADGLKFAEWLHEENITSAYIPPMMTADLEQWLHTHPGQSRLRRLLTGVEPVPERRLMNIARAVPELCVINGYGPTEAAVYCTCCCVDGSSTPRRTTPIGKPLDGVKIHLLDENRMPVADGEAGEIYIGGDQVARGYLDNDPLTAERFLDTPQGRLYRTGDLARILPDGNLMFAGRVDRQVKFMGYRIEPGEIESALCGIDAISEAVVTVREDTPGDQRLIAYYTLYGNSAPDAGTVRETLAEFLPPYMVPSLYICLDSIPLTPNGKTDRSALPAPAAKDLQNLRDGEYIAPSGTTERAVASAFAELLGMERAGRTDNFFLMGGHSLLATQLISRIASRLNVDVALRDVYEHSTVAKLAAQIDLRRKERNRFEEIPLVRGRDTYPLTPSQRTMWMLHQSDRSGTLSNIPEIIHLTGPLDVTVFERAFNEIICRHDSLRMVFFMEDGEIVQRPLDKVFVPVELIDLSSLSAEDRDRRLDEIRKETGRHRFDLSTGPLIRIDLVKLAKEQFQLFFNIHHIAADGWGISLFNTEFEKVYEAFLDNRPSPLPPVECQYSDVAVWMSQRLADGIFQPQIDYWKEKLAAPRPDIHFPLDRERPEIPAHSGTRHAFIIPPGLTEELKALGRRENASLFMVLAAIWQTLLHRATGSNDIITGTAIANRNHPQLEQVVGTFINALALRTDFSGAPVFADVLERVRRTALEAYSNQDIPFEKIMEAVSDGTRHPLFRNSLILHNMPMPVKHFCGLTLTDDEVGNDTSKMDMLLYFIEREGQLEGQLEYDTELFTAKTAEQIVADFMTLARQVVKDCCRLLDDYLQTGEEEAVTCYVIGEGTLCLRCIEALRRRGIRVQGLISPDVANRRWAKAHGIAWHHPDEGFDTVLSPHKFDYLFSIVNSHVLSPEILSLPRRYAINYHDAPLPKYAGVYSTAWAIINREKQHGISWHLMTEKVDSGDLLKQRTVAVDEHDTSFTLNAKCYDAAIEALDELALELAEGRETRTRQNASKRTYCPLHKRPRFGGLIDWSAPQEEINALRRALDFGNQPNELGLPKVFFGGELYVIKPDGSLLSIDGEPSQIRFPAIEDPSSWVVNEPGFSELGKRIEQLNASICRHERFWVRRFRNFQPLELPDCDCDESDKHRYACDDQALFLCFLARFCLQETFTTGWNLKPEEPAFFAGTVPLHVELNIEETLFTNIKAAEKALETCRRHKTFARDLFLRYPDVRRPIICPIKISEREVLCSPKLWEHFVAFRRSSDVSLPLYMQSILTDRDRRDLEKFQARTPGFGDTRCIHQLFEDQAAKTPDAVAVEGERASLTYAELNQLADSLAVQLQEQGVSADTPVGLFVNRSLEMCIGILGILKAGGAYVPLDPEYPSERIEFIIGDASMPVIVTVSSLAESPILAGHKTICADRIKPDGGTSDFSTDPSSLAYIFYTSGSTGKPKGVMVEHHSVVNHCRSSIHTYGINSRDRVLQFFSMNFDGSVEELFPAWACGAAVVLRSSELASSVSSFEQFVTQRNISVADLPTAYWHEWIRNLREIPASLRAVIIGGEKVSAELCRVWLQKGGKTVRLFNTYGPTECTVVSTVYELTGVVAGEVPIGRPIAETALYVTDRLRQPMPAGMSGELLIGGEGVARGYLNRSDLTDAKFISNPWGVGMLYCTGDLVCRHSNGTIEFRGRVDNQVKIRGFRIEPDEIAAVLEQHAGIAQAVVIARDDLSEHKELAAYYISEPGYSLLSTELHDYAAANLPDYMVPSVFMELDEFPTAPGGKVDRRALPLPTKTIARARENYVAPETPPQKVLAEIWETVLGMDGIGINDNFFDLGGHSLLAIQLVERILAAGMSITVAQLFQYPTIAQMAETVKLSGDAEHKVLVCLKKGEASRPPLFLLHSAPGDLLGYSNLVHNLPGNQPVYGFQSLGLVDPKHVHSTILEMAAYYVSVLKEFMPDGPVLLGGWCYGGYVAMEMARQLKEQGRDVRLLAMIDAWAYPPAERKIAFYRRRLQLMKLIGFKAWGKIVFERIRNLFSDQMADAVKVLDGVQVNEGVLVNRAEVYRRNREAALQYQPTFYPGHVSIFRSDELAEWFLPDMTMEWAELTEDQDIYLIPGGHRDMLREPSVKVLADSLAKSIRNAV